MKSRALGKGLSALIPEKQQGKEGQGEVTYLKASLIANNTYQPRTHYDDKKLKELQESIEEKGVLQPILVRAKTDGYEVIAGERRLRAAKLTSMETVPVIIKDVSDQEALVLALIENIQREELNPIEEAEGYKRLIDEFHYSQETIASSVGKDRSTVSNLLRLLKLPSAVQKRLYSGDISVGHARALLALDSVDAQESILNKIIKKGLSVREVERQIQGAGRRKGASRKKTKDVRIAELIALEEALQRRLGTKVKIIPQKNKKGKIVVEYYSLEDLKRIVLSLKD